MNHSHVLAHIQASNGKRLQLAVDIYPGHPHVEAGTVFKYIVDPCHLIIQGQLHGAHFLLVLPPALHKLPHLMTVGAAQTPVLIPAFIGALKAVQVVSLLDELLSLQLSQLLTAVEVVL